MLLIVAAWLSVSALVSINEVTVHQARLVGLLGRVNHLGLWLATQANSAFYPQQDLKWVPVPVKVRWRSAAGE